ncbi:3,4-dihydroxy-2-butanone-4-phosphate synthase [Methanosphaera sp. ISO3-F5]|uniref:3,4-dihydroxy-2-butanone-4-phosphate synthase n=1 Tax=Methanosphaera sp. ISO3-F5 TaxID=1452353 RepID=UPI002B256F60|nr:3,4-dihydroxy-2-butanone-4-phosphate synthase [Methanosphaera sp. ISO3-F5]WQH63818.1 3,4-dihydroxy-2-butanone-4-phosphate synthase [Methanosphaera sp. ISO3-F5]
MEHEEMLTGNYKERVETAVEAIKNKKGVIVTDDESRENEGDMFFSAQYVTNEQMALLIREGSGIVCLCMTEEKADELELPLMVEDNTSTYGTGFTITIEAAEGVTTGVSAADRVTTVRAASNDDAKPEDLHHPGHVFPLRAKNGGVLERDGHTEANIELMKLAGLKPMGVLCEITNPDGTMARMPEIIEFSKVHDMPIVTINDIIQYISE